MKTSDAHKIADELEDLAGLIRERAGDALRLSRDWQSPLRSGGELGSRGASEYTPTESAALNPDPLSLEHPLLVAGLQSVFQNALGLHARLLFITSNARVHNDRAGIGTCSECPRYCSGHKDDRLRNGLCPACYRKTLPDRRRVTA